MYGAILEGKEYILTKEELSWIKRLFKLKVKTPSRNIIDVYNYIYNYLKKKYKYEGPCSKYMLEKPSICCSLLKGFKLFNINNK